MSGIVFINYRRNDAAGMAGRLFDRLENEFSSEQLFFDVDNIPPGEDFVAYLNDKVSVCDVLLAVIGRDWQSQLDGQDYEDASKQSGDFVRIEIEAALRQGKTVIPVLVSGAQMPRAGDLPKSLQPFSRRNAVRLSHERFKADAAGIAAALKAALASAEQRRVAAEAEAARRAEEERKAKGARDAKEHAKTEAAQRKSTVAGLSPDQIAKAEELANWEFVKEDATIQDLQDHLARYPGGVTARMARAKLEAVVWEELGSAPSTDALTGFLKTFPDGKHAATAAAKLDLLGQAEAEPRAKQQSEPEKQRAALETKREQRPSAAPSQQKTAPHAPGASPEAEARRPWKKPARGLFRRPATYLVGLPLIMVLIAGALFALAPATVVSFLPGASRLYEMAGMAMPNTGLQFVGVRYGWAEDGGQNVLEVEGKVRNTHSAAVAVPTIVIVLLDENREAISEWATEVETRELAPDAETPFMRRIPSPPSNVRTLKVRFDNAGG